MLLIRRQHAKISLDSSGVVIADIAADHVDKILPAGKTMAIIPLPLEDAPEALHRPVINTVGHSGHTLCHTSFLQLVVKAAVCILKATIRVKDRVGIGVALNSLLKGLKHQRIVIPVTDHKGDDASVVEVQNGAEIDLVDLNALIPLELRYIREPLFIGRCSVEIPIQHILSNVLRIPGPPGTAVITVLDCGFDILL